MKLKDFIREKLTAEDLSQAAFGRKVQLSQAAINKILLAEHSPNLDTIRKIASSYGVPVSYFLDEEPNNVIPTGDGKPVLEQTQQLLNSLSVDDQRHILLYIKIYIQMKGKRRYDDHSRRAHN